MSRARAHADGRDSAGVALACRAEDSYDPPCDSDMLGNGSEERYRHGALLGGGATVSGGPTPSGSTCFGKVLARVVDVSG